MTGPMRVIDAQMMVALTGLERHRDRLDDHHERLVLLEAENAYLFARVRALDALVTDLMTIAVDPSTGLADGVRARLRAVS